MKSLFIIIICCSIISGYAQTIDGGNDHSIMLCEDSIIWTVGSNTAGQLGDGTTTNALTPIKVIGLADIIDVQAGASHSLALKSDGTVWSWGNNNDGQLGNNTTTPSSVPIQVPGLNDIVKIVAGAFHNVAIESDSTAWIWGDNQLNQINSTGTDKLFPIPGGINIIDIAVGNNYTAVLDNDSLIKINSNVATGIQLSNVTSLGSGSRHFFMIKSDNTIWAWGDNQYGQLGDNTTIDQTANAAVQVSGLNNVISITGGQRHSMALKDDGTVWTWGWNGLGQLGNNTLIDELTPIQVPGLDSVIEIAAGSHHCMAKRSDSTIWVWGNNGSGQLGNDTAINTTIPVQMMLSCIYQCPAPQVYPGNDITICSGDSAIVFGTYQQVANTYYDSLLTSNGCDSIIEVILTLSTPPVVSFTGLDTTYCNTNSIVNLTGTPSGGSFSGPGVLGSVFNPLAAGLGTHTITYTYNDGTCTVMESQGVIVTNCTGIDDLVLNDFKIYPNPSSGIINIQPKSMVYISNILGEVIFTGESSQIDLSEYGAGIYFIRVGSTIKKLVLTDNNSTD